MLTTGQFGRICVDSGDHRGQRGVPRNGHEVMVVTAIHIHNTQFPFVTVKRWWAKEIFLHFGRSPPRERTCIRYFPDRGCC